MNKSFRSYAIKRSRNWKAKRTNRSVLAIQAVTRTLNPYKRGDARYMPTIEEELEDYKKLKLSEVKDIHAQVFVREPKVR